MAKKAPKAGPRRKIGERTESVSVKLSPMQVEDERAKVCDLVREREELDSKRKSVNSDYKAKIADVDDRIKHALGAVNTARITKEVTIEEWVTDRNEVIRIDKATGDELGRRNATAHELQEELPLAKPSGDADDDDGEAELDREIASDAASDPADSDFGDRA